MKRILLVSAVAMTVLGAAVARADGEKLAVFTKNNTNPYFQAVRLGADSAAKQMKATVTHFVPTKPDSIPEQMSQVEDAIVRKPDAIVFTPVDFKAMTPGIEKINAAGKHLLDHGLRVAPDLGRIVLDPTRLRVDLRVLALRQRRDGAALVEQDEPRTRRALVDRADVSVHELLLVRDRPVLIVRAVARDRDGTARRRRRRSAR